MQNLRLGAACLNQTPLAWESNRENILAAIAAARDAQVAVLCLPELCITGYGCEDTFFSTGVQKTAIQLLLEIVPKTQGLVVSLGLPLAIGGNIYNVCALASDGKLLGLVGKQHLAGDGIHYEPRWFDPWPEGDVREVSMGGKPYPVGDLLFDCGGVKIGMEICRDAWVGDRPGRRLAARGADILLNPSASHFAFAKQEIRRRLVLEGSNQFHVSYAYSNLLGNESGRAVFDGGTLIASRGKILAVGPRFSFADTLLTTAEIDLEATRHDRANAKKTYCENGGATVENDFKLPTPTAPREPTSASTWDSSPPPKEEEFARSVALALYDYLRKSKAGGLVVSLSGGADSAAVATMVWLMVQLAVDEIGHDAFADKLAPIPGLSEAKKNTARMRRILRCVYQATRNSSQTTRNAAQTVAEAIGAEFLHWNIDSLVDTYLETVSQAVRRELTWDQDDLALQNIQARARGPGAWLLANLRGSLLLATSNRSEAAVGYATMDGDTCGGLAPIAGIDKAFLLEWLRWMETTGPVGVGRLPALSSVNAQQPTAELRPQEQSQTDENDLMPYRVLDAIERAAIRDRLLPIEVYKTVRPQFKNFSSQQLGHWVERFFRLWCRNQWKRERYAPSFHLDDENLDPKTWCRFPILSGGYERELKELHKYLQ